MGLLALSSMTWMSFVCFLVLVHIFRGSLRAWLAFCLLWFLGAHFVAYVIDIFSLMYIHARIAIVAFLHFCILHLCHMHL